MSRKTILLSVTRRIGFMAVLIYFGSVAVIALREDAYLYYPTRYPEYWAEPPGGAFETEFQLSEGSRIHGVWFPGRETGPVILFLHGNAGHLVNRYPLIRFLQNLESRPGVLIVDYPGYGKSTGKPKESNLYETGTAACRYLQENLNVPPDRLILFGRSLGAAAALHTAITLRCAGLVMECPLLSVPHMAGEYYPYLPGLGWFSRQRFDNEKMIRKLNVPLLIIHGGRDRVIPVHHGRELFETALEPKRYVEIPAADHDDIYLIDTKQYRRAWMDFIRDILPEDEPAGELLLTPGTPESAVDPE
ncbi:alpha/beta hydrolase [bacterium]|nr:alpha/beta hydrolase [candidate division CSSED10-310 bacterium]